MQIVAHRGASLDAPENTLQAFAIAREQGAHSIEIDVQLTRDDEVVVFHDWDLERLCGVRGLVRDLRLAELRQLTVGGEPIPTLEEVLKTQDRPEGLLIELKSEMWNDVRVAARTAKVLRETRALDRGAVVASSFNPVCLLTLWRLNPSIPRGLLAHRKGPVFLRRAWFRGLVGASELHMEACLITPRWARAAHRAGRRLVAWTVNDVEEARRLQKLGVDGVITDTPGALRQALALAPT